MHWTKSYQRHSTMIIRKIPKKQQNNNIIIISSITKVTVGLVFRY